MRHHKSNRKFGREKNLRVALMKSLAHNLITQGKIVTTEPKAKELRPFVEKLVTNSKSGTLSARRLSIARVGLPATKELFDNLGPKYKARAGGYTRIVKLGSRRDGSKTAVIEFVN